MARVLTVMGNFNRCLCYVPLGFHPQGMKRKNDNLEAGRKDVKEIHHVVGERPQEHAAAQVWGGRPKTAPYTPLHTANLLRMEIHVLVASQECMTTCQAVWCEFFGFLLPLNARR